MGRKSYFRKVASLIEMRSSSHEYAMHIFSVFIYCTTINIENCVHMHFDRQINVLIEILYVFVLRVSIGVYTQRIHIGAR